MKPNQSLKDMAGGWQGQRGVLASVPAGTTTSRTGKSGWSGLLPCCLVSSQQSQYVFLSRPTRTPTTGKSHSTFFIFSLPLPSSLFLQSVPSFLTISFNAATRVQQEHSQLTALYVTSMQTATNSVVHTERTTRPASLKMHCIKLTSGKVPIPSSYCIHCLIDEI